MGELVQTCRARIVQDEPPLRRAYIEPFAEPVLYGVHGGIAAFYKRQPERELPATLDHMIAAIGG